MWVVLLSFEMVVMMPLFNMNNDTNITSKRWLWSWSQSGVIKTVLNERYNMFNSLMENSELPFL